MDITKIIEDILKQNQDLVVEYCNGLQDCEDGSTPNMAIYGIFLSKLPYNDVSFIKMCLEYFTVRLKAECRKLKNDNIN